MTLIKGTVSAIPTEASTTAQGFHTNTDSPTYGKWYSIGNQANSAGFSGTGSPAEAYGPFVVYQKYGTNNGSNAAVTKTTQAGYVIANYFGPTTDDSAEAFSTFVGMKDTGVGFNQAKPITGFEAIAQLEGSNTANVGDAAPLLAVGGRTSVLGTASAATAIGFKASHNPSGGPPYGTTTKYIGFFQPAASGATTAYGVYTVDPISSETSLVLGKSAYSGSLSAKLTGNSDSGQTMLLLNLPTNTDASGTLTGIRIVAPASQTKPLQEWYGAGSGSAGVRVDSGGNFAARTAIKVMESTFSSDLIRMDSSGLTITTGLNIILSTSAGTKLGTATTQKLGFWNAAPVVQQARPTDAASIITLLTTLGLCA